MMNQGKTLSSPSLIRLQNEANFSTKFFQTANTYFGLFFKDLRMNLSKIENG